ncbi:RNase A-like domain-containing protein, partial [Heyndrickxia coagulans]
GISKISTAGKAMNAGRLAEKVEKLRVNTEVTPALEATGAGPTKIPYNVMDDLGVRIQKAAEERWTGNKSIDNIKQGDKSSLAPGGGLTTHEAKGGHLIERHIGKTDEELLERLESNPKITGSSTFKDRMTAEKVANTVLSNPKNIEKIQKWLSDPNSRPTLPLRFKGNGEIIGRSVSRNSKEVENVTNAKIVLKKDNNGSFILTGYPVK